MRTDLVADALRSACDRRRPTGPVIFHSDRGCQYTSGAFACLADQLSPPPAVGRTHRPVLGARSRGSSSPPSNENCSGVGPGRAEGRSPHRHLRVGRELVQPTQAPQQPRVPQSRRIRGRPRGLPPTPRVSVKTQQAYSVHDRRKATVDEGCCARDCKTNGVTPIMEDAPYEQSERDWSRP